MQATNTPNTASPAPVPGAVSQVPQGAGRAVAASCARSIIGAKVTLWPLPKPIRHGHMPAIGLPGLLDIVHVRFRRRPSTGAFHLHRQPVGAQVVEQRRPLALQFRARSEPDRDLPVPPHRTSSVQRPSQALGPGFRRRVPARTTGPAPGRPPGPGHRPRPPPPVRGRTGRVSARSRRTAQLDQRRAGVRVKLTSVRRGDVDVHPGHSGAGRVQQPGGELFGHAARHEFAVGPARQFRQ